MNATTNARYIEKIIPIIENLKSDAKFQDKDIGNNPIRK